eukprot:39321_1
MPLFVQLNVNELPQEFKYKIKNGQQYHNHLIQLFYCIDMECEFTESMAKHQRFMTKLLEIHDSNPELSIHEAKSQMDALNMSQKTKHALVRIINMNEKKYKDEKYCNETIKKINAQNYENDIITQNFRVREGGIIGWTHYPIECKIEGKIDSLKEYGLDYKFYNFEMKYFKDKQQGQRLYKDKLLGHPGFLQDHQYRYSECTECGEIRKEMIFQTDGSVIGYMFGDGGVGQIFA